jgi:ATP-dependent Clp protease adaptor protein ClpS
MPTQQPAIETNIEERLRMLPRYHVLLHNDEFNDMEHVVRSLLYTIMSLTINQAVAIMLEAHNSGIAHVISCPRETAEFYAQTLNEFGLTSTIEPE